MIFFSENLHPIISIKSNSHFINMFIENIFSVARTIEKILHNFRNSFLSFSNIFSNKFIHITIVFCTVPNSTSIFSSMTKKIISMHSFGIILGSFIQFEIFLKFWQIILSSENIYFPYHCIANLILTESF